MPDIPLAYSVLRYRRAMHISYYDVIKMPASVYFNDQEMMSLEYEYGPPN